MRRRTFLQGLGVGAAGVALGGWSSRAAWGELPPGVWSGVTPARKVLEVFLWGGLAPFESLYYRDVAGSRTRGFDPDVQALSPLGLSASPAALGDDARGKPVHLGPFAAPLWRRPDLWARTRVVALGHRLLSHEAAVPYGVTGRGLGSPGASGLGAPLARRARRDLAPGAHPLPFAYVLGNRRALGDPMFAGLQAAGAHGGDARPLALTMDGPLPGPAASDRDAAVAALLAAPRPARLLRPDGPRSDDATRRALQLGAYLLTRTGEEEARYVGIVDAGLDGLGFGYDVHGFEQARRTSAHLGRVLAALQEVIRDPARPAPDDADKLDLSDTLIVLKTEFGRTPFRSSGMSPDPTSGGRDHWPYAYAGALLGGPVGRGVSGALADGADPGVTADVPYSPTDLQAASLLAAGVDPFAPGNLPLELLSGPLQAAGVAGRIRSLVALRRQLLTGVG